MSRRRTKSPPFVMLPRWLTATAAWRHLAPPERAIYLELRERFNGFNNGTIGLGCREAAQAVNVSPGTANRALQKLSDIGFTQIGTPSAFNTNGRRATEWLLTELPDDRTGHKALKTFASWKPGKKNPSVTTDTLSVSGETQRPKATKKDDLRLTTDTYGSKAPGFASHHRHTSRYTTSPGTNEVGEGGGIAPPQRGASQPTPDALPPTDALIRSLARLQPMAASDAG